MLNLGSLGIREVVGDDSGLGSGREKEGFVYLYTKQFYPLSSDLDKLGEVRESRREREKMGHICFINGTICWHSVNFFRFSELQISLLTA